MTGLSESNIKNIQSLLIECGMSSALPSRMEQLKADDIIKTICLAHNVNLQNPNITPINVSPIWNNLLMDLILANCQQQVWGWADTNAIYLLDYLKNQDMGFVFVLVYDLPESVFSVNTEDYIDETDFERRAQQWLNYNATLLDFYKKNQDRCVLVSVEDVRHSTVDFIAQLSNKLAIQNDTSRTHDDNLMEEGVNQTELDTIIPEKKGRVSARRQKKKLKESESKNATFMQLKSASQALLSYSNEVVGDLSTFEQSDLRNYFSTILIDQNNDLKALYDELRKASNVKNVPNTRTSFDSNKLFELWNEVVGLEAIVGEQDQQLLSYQIKLENLEVSSKALQNVYEKNLNEVKENARLCNEKNKEELTALLLEKKEIAKKSEWRANHNTELSKMLAENKKQLDAFHKKMGNTTNHGMEQENKLLIFQLAQLQEEITKLYAQQKKISSGQKKLPTYYGAVDRMRSSLKYQLGAVILEHSKDVKKVIHLPQALIKLIQEQKKLQKIESELPLLEKYTDYYQAEKLKSHLSYRIGNVLVENLPKPQKWMKIPLDISKEISNFHRVKKSK